MDAFLINGQKNLSGQVITSGAKNAILPIMTACLLAKGKSILTNVPRIHDFKNMAHLLRIIGARVEVIDDSMIIDATDACFPEAPYELVNKMRASIYVLGPFLARFRRGLVAFPGGCAIGTRPVDLHLMCMEKLGASITIEHGDIIAECPDGLKGAQIEFPFISVGATANCLMAAVMAEGESIIKNTALEPDIESLIAFLIKMGAHIEKIGKNDLRVIGVKELHPVTMRMIPDRIEAGTLLLASAITKNNFTIKNCEPLHLTALIEKMTEAGCRFQIDDDSITVIPAQDIKPVDIVTEPYPGFPTDLQAQFLTYMCLSTGTSHIKDTIFPDRFMHVAELNRLGANITVKEATATVRGVKAFSGAEVMATDLRASAALVLAGITASGTTKISRIYHIDRGYERIEQKLNSLGADITRIIT
jgi:UDP-N-acetylglucosamine 1-carboxyvinyltransferase